MKVLEIVKKRCRSIDFFSILVLIVSGFFVYLGFWQIERADEKKTIIAALSHEPVPSSLSSLNNVRHQGYQKIQLKGGAWLEHGYVKKNVVRDGQLGIQVYKLYCQDPYCIIVNLGWLSTQDEVDLSKITLNTTLIGVVRALPYVLIKEKAPLEQYQGFGAIVGLDVGFLSKQVGRFMVPFELLIDQSLTNYQQLTTIPKVSVARHYGYALQFYLLALVLAIGYIYVKK